MEGWFHREAEEGGYTNYVALNMNLITHSKITIQKLKLKLRERFGFLNPCFIWSEIQHVWIVSISFV